MWVKMYMLNANLFQYSEAYVEHPLEVMLYGLKYENRELMNLTGIKSLELSRKRVFENFSPGVYIAWVRLHVE